MAFVRYQSPDDPAFVVFDTSRFRVDHGIFLLRVGPVRAQIEAKLEEHRGWNLVAMKLIEENRRLVACLEWLESIGDDPDLVVIPDLKHEPAIDLVANRVIGDGDYAKTFCPACEAEYSSDRIAREPWSFEEDGTTVRGLRSTCRQGHTIHVLTDSIDAIDLESEEN